MQQEPENLLRELTQCHALIRELLEKLRHLEALTEKQKHQLAQLLRYRYGQRADRVQADQLVLWALEELGSPPAEKPEEQNRARKAQQRGHGRKDLPRKRVEHEAPEKERICGQCGCPKERIGQEVSEQLEYIPASFYVLEHVCPKYACRLCEGELVRASKPMQPIEKGLPGPGLLAHVITSKYSDHLPLYRLEGIFWRHGLQIARSTMCDWMAACAESGQSAL